MAHYVRRPTPRSDFGGSGYLDSVMAPRGSCWEEFNTKDLWKQRISVPNATGAHKLGWTILNKNREPAVLFSLYQNSIDGFVATRTMSIPARPTFSIMNEMHDVFSTSAYKKMSAPETGFPFEMPGLKQFNEDMEEMSEFLVDEMSQWFRSSEHFSMVMAHVYMAVSGDVMNWLGKAQTRPSAPGPGQPGN